MESFQREIELKELEVSADLYARLYERDQQAKEWVADSSRDWPTRADFDEA